MLSIFSIKPKLKDLIPNDFVDIHSHILPAIDDGAKTANDSKFLIQKMLDLGFKKAITTPHTMQHVWFNTSETIKNTFEKFFVEEKEMSEKINLQVASEYFLDEHFLEILEKKDILTLKNNFVLVEMSFLNAPPQLHEIIFELQLKGYQPILAHPERYLHYQNNIKNYENLKKLGFQFQLNLTSCVGYYGAEVAKTADLLLKNEMIDFVGSDIHHQQHINAFNKNLVIKNTKKLELAFSKNIEFN